jgi:hypothetical protein
MLNFKKLFSFLALIHSVKPLKLTLMIAPIGMFNLNSILVLIPNVKWAIVATNSFVLKI